MGGAGAVQAGHQFGDWAVLRLADPRPCRREAYFLCRCECGFEKEISKSSLINGMSTKCRTCSNSSNEKARIARQRPAVPGDRFGRWVVLDESETRGGDLYHSCRCDCGVVSQIQATVLRGGHSSMCQHCSRSSRATHGETVGGKISCEYKTWVDIQTRCNNVDDTRYGGRGIRVAEEWLGPGGFERFLAHVGRRPSAKHSIDRIDNDGNYEPGNVRWATAKEQARNKRSNRILVIDGEAAPLVVWIERVGMKVEKRLGRGWSDREAVLGRGV